MKKRAAVKGQKQEEKPVAMSVAMQQLMLPLLLAMDATKKGLLSFVQQMGMVVLSELLVDGGRADRRSEGQAHRGAHAPSLGYGHDARRASAAVTCRCRIRAFEFAARVGAAEVALPSIEALRDGDPMSERVVEQIALGVSTRGYERSLEPVDESIETRGASKSNASRALIDATTEKLAQFVSRKLDDVDLVAMFIDGIEFAGHSVLIALGVTIDGTKTPLGIWAGSTENTVVVTELLSNLVARGLRVDASMLFVIDGGKAIRKALRDVFGDRAIVQRCQVHKARNVRDHLSEARRAYVAKQMRDAYNSTTAATAKKKLMQLASWLDSNGEDGAAASLREGLDETLTVMRLNLPASLRRTFATTNADREHERLAPSHRPKRQAMEGRDDDPTLGRPRHRRSAEGIPAREGLRPHALPRRRSSTGRRDGGVQRRRSRKNSNEPPLLREVQQGAGRSRALAALGLRAVKTVATARGPLHPTQQSMIDLAQRLTLGTELDVDGLEPITPESLAASIRAPEGRERVIRGMVLVCMARGEVTREDAADIERYARVLGVTEHAVTNVRQLAEGRLALLRYDVNRRAFTVGPWRRPARRKACSRCCEPPRRAPASAKTRRPRRSTRRSRTIPCTRSAASSGSTTSATTSRFRAGCTPSRRSRPFTISATC